MINTLTANQNSPEFKVADDKKKKIRISSADVDANIFLVIVIVHGVNESKSCKHNLILKCFVCLVIMAQLAGLLIYASGIKKNIILHLLPLKNSQVL